MAADELLTIPEVAEIAKVGMTTVYRWVAQGLIDRVELGSPRRPKTRIKRSDLDAFFTRNTIPGRKVA